MSQHIVRVPESDPEEPLCPGQVIPSTSIKSPTSLSSFKFIFSSVSPQRHTLILLSPVFKCGIRDPERLRKLPKATQLGCKVDLKSGLAAYRVQPLFYQLFFFPLLGFFSKITKVAVFIATRNKAKIC